MLYPIELWVRPKGKLNYGPVCAHATLFESILGHVQAENLARLAFGHNFQRPAAHFAVGCQPLALHARVHDHVKFLAAERALDGSGNFHAAI